MRLISVVICGLFYSALANNEKQPKNIGIFNVVRFPNAACEGSNGNMGTCYTAEECEDNSGTASGSCADGYGVCCIFSINCGGTSSQNLTMFMSNNVAAGACGAQICKTNSDIVQLRLDFTSFVISNPANGVGTSFAILNGIPDPSAGSALFYSINGQCNTDSFSVSSPGSVGSPEICGVNTGDHMYIDASDSCNTLTFQIGDVTFTRQWNIKVTQYAMDFPNKAPKGCLQYHFAGDGNDDGDLDPTIIRSFNWNGGNGRHLANQDYNICIRRESSIRRVCYSQDATAFLNDFLISTGGAPGDSNAPANLGLGLHGKATGFCGNYGASGKGGGGKAEFDHLQIPRASTFMMGIPTGLFVGTPTAGPIAVGVNDNFCGACLGKVHSAACQATVAGAAAVVAGSQQTICSRATPFLVRFVTDAGEGLTETVQTGFNLQYTTF
jgi:hypothetical protein